MGGLATIGAAEPLPSLLLGNPVHLATGNKYQLDVDLPANPAAPGLELVRHYNGLSVRGGALGRNWALSYDTRLLRRGGRWLVRQADGSERAIPPPAISREGVSTWRWPSGRELVFDSNGHLVIVRAGRTTLARIHRHAAPDRRAGLVRRVDSPAGHALHFHYEERHGQHVLTAVDTPLGRFRYHYDAPPLASGHAAPRLTAVERPDGMTRHYHYEPERQAGNPYALTGISLGATGLPPLRMATWGYDLYGRVATMHRHGQGQTALEIHYLRRATGQRAGLTRVRGSQGQEQWLRFLRLGREYRLLERRATAQPDDATLVRHDSRGRLRAIGGLELQRDEFHGLRALRVPEQGWPGLALRRERRLNRYAWHSTTTGWTTLEGDAAGRPAALRHANGDMLRVRYDAQGRPAKLTETLAGGMRSNVTRLWWNSTRLVRIQHPNEDEARHYDAHGRLATRTVRRPAVGGGPDTVFRDTFHYDHRGRLSRHGLPEGGALHYTWSNEPGRPGSLAAIHWEDARGRRHPVITSEGESAGYRYGNGLALATGALRGPHVDTLVLGSDDETLWVQYRRHDPRGRIVSDAHVHPSASRHEETRFVHDDRSRLKGARQERDNESRHEWYAWRDDGRLAARFGDGKTLRPGVERDASGLPVRWGNFVLGYGPGRRLESVALADGGRPVAQYLHNALGHRISAARADGTTHFLHVDGQVAAEAHRAEGESRPRVVRRYVRAGLTPVALIEYPADAPPRLYAVHADLSGAPRMLTDSDRRIRWLASYSPTGRASRVLGDIDFPLRLLGQYEDAETGWHDNVLRTYVPDLGQFLEPDPLGPVPGSDTYGYAAQQPWRYADPDGLLLFAFDGTRQSADTMGNVWRLAQAYRDGAAHYHSGPGNSHFLDWDAIVAWRAGRILENQWQALLTAVEHHPPGTVLPIDIVGFSRGAALARHFGNRVASHVSQGVFRVTDSMRGEISACVDLRFMGLFDTVGQFGVGGSHNHLYDLGVSEMWSWVAHAVAMHEHRWAFPLTSADAGGAGNVVEAPFIGAHADIGGGVALHEPPSGAAQGGAGTPVAPSHTASDLADVALAWMHWQAIAASVDFDALAPSDTTADTPILRDMRSPLWRTVQRGDRAVLAPSGARRHTYQDDDARLGRATRAELERLIERVENWRMQADEGVGVVDMTGYAQWLAETLGWPAQ